MAKLAVSGGIDILQMREKERPRDELVKLGRELRRICKKGKKGKIGVEKGDAGKIGEEKGDAIFIVNDDPSVAKEVGADGVHLGQEDLERWSLKKTRNLLGPDRVIGISTHSLAQFKKANSEDFDYIAFGPIFPTRTKDYCIGTGDVEEALKTAEKPVVFIGGINLTNIDELLEKGARNIALIRGITEAEDVEEAARSFRERIEKGR